MMRDDREAEMSPLDEIEAADLTVELAALDEEQRMFDPNAHPRPPSPKEESTTDIDGEREVDIMDDTPSVDEIVVEPERIDDVDITLD